jgi:hypothetical protein
MEGVASGNRNLPDVFIGAETGGDIVGDSCMLTDALVPSTG